MAGSTNIQQFNPTAANQENDTTYTGDSQRVNGVATDAIIPSASINKFRYQASTLAAALSLALSDKGYVISDGSPGAVPISGGQSTAVANLAAVLANILTNADMATIIAAVIAGFAGALPAGTPNTCGYFKLPDCLRIGGKNLIVQIGLTSAFATGGPTAFVSQTFASSGGVAFPNKALVAIANPDGPSFNNGINSQFLITAVTALSTAGLTVGGSTNQGTEFISNVIHAYWIAVGY